MINVWKMEDKGNIFASRKGDVLNCRAGKIHLVLITNEEGEGYSLYIYIYVCISKVERLLHTATCIVINIRSVAHPVTQLLNAATKLLKNI